MEPRSEGRVRARGLIWDVAGADGDRLDLRCADGDMTGLEFTIFAPPEIVEPVAPVLDPRQPAPLVDWRLFHRAEALRSISGRDTFAVRSPGRVGIEPYQLVPLLRALEMPRVRLLLADGVGLGKTVQACLIAAELIVRRRAHRILIVSPPGPLLSQWERETRLRFGLKFTPITSAADLWDIRRASERGANPFDAMALCLTSLDFARQDHVMEELRRTAWDLVIIDEAHHCTALGTGGVTDRRRLAALLAARSDGLLLLTATPHDGRDAHFASLIALLDPSLVDGGGVLSGRTYRRHVVRRLKAHIVDPATGAQLFHRRQVTPVRVDVLGPEHETARMFHRALAAFVVPRLRGRDGDGLAFVSLLKRSASTITACVATLRVVIDRLARDEPETKAEKAERARALKAWRRRAARFGGLSAAEEAGQAVLEAEAMAETLRLDPGDEAAALLRLGLAAETADPRLAALVQEVRLIRLEHPRANILIYTEYADSQDAAARALRCIGVDVLTIAGGDTDAAREAAAERFGGEDGLILISTDSLSEGLNLQRHCFHLIHLDLPYNPNRLEQRNGRIDRYGQTNMPDIRYLYVPGTFEERLLLHLIVKYEKARASLDVMPDTLGVTAEPDGLPLMRGFSEPSHDLFRDDATSIRSLDRAVEDTNPETLSSLLREIDRAFDAFDLMAVSHGWYAAHGINAGPPVLRQAAAARGEPDDLTGFVRDVIARETGERTAGNILRPPSFWLDGLEGLPGISAGQVRITGDPSSPPTMTEAFLGRAHPLVMRAIALASRLPAAVSVALGPEPGLLLTFLAELPAGGRIVFRRLVGVLARDGQSPVACDPLAFATPSHAEAVWDRWFAAWPGAVRAEAQDLALDIAAEWERSFLRDDEAVWREDLARSREWVRLRADRLCGPVAPAAGDLFGAPAGGEGWRHDPDPVTRLAGFAASAEAGPATRREAIETLETWHTRSRRDEPGPMTLRQIGMLMVVPADV